VEQALGRLTVDRLKRLAAVALVGSASRKGLLVSRIASQLEGEPLVALWERLGELDRAAVAEVVHGPEHRFQPDQFRAKYGGDPNWGARDRWSSLVSASVLGLFIHDQATIPDDLLARLERFVPPPVTASIAQVGDLPASIERRVEGYDHAAGKRRSWTEAIDLTVDERERAAPHELLAVLRLVDAGRVGVSDKTRRPTSAAVRTVSSVLSGGDFYADEEVGPIRAFAWPLLVQAAGLAERAGPRLRLTASGRRALVEPVGPTLRRMWERWLDNRLLDELGRINAIRGQTGRGKRGLTAPGERRGAIAGALRDCPVGRWTGIDELFRYMRAAGHDFEVTRDAWTLYVGDPQYGSLGYDCRGGWEALQGRYALCVLFEYAATLGLIDVAHVPPADAREDFRELSGAEDLEFLSRYDGLSYVRVTGLGAYCLGVVDEYRPPAVEVRGVLSVLSTFEIVATEESLSPADRVVLDRYADSSSDYVWRLTPARLVAELEASGSLGDLSEFLAARSITPIPASVRELFADLHARAGRVRDGGEARLIECADAALATLVANDVRTRRLCLLAGERHLVVPARSERAFRRAVREIGYPLLAPGLRDAA
jgi:Helicase conserved C-terminal domain